MFEHIKMDQNQDHRRAPTQGSTKGNTTVIFSLDNEVGSLIQALQVFQVGG